MPCPAPWEGLLQFLIFPRPDSFLSVQGNRGKSGRRGWGAAGHLQLEDPGETKAHPASRAILKIWAGYTTFPWTRSVIINGRGLVAAFPPQWDSRSHRVFVYSAWPSPSSPRGSQARHPPPVSAPLQAGTVPVRMSLSVCPCTLQALSPHGVSFPCFSEARHCLRLPQLSGTQLRAQH